MSQSSIFYQNFCQTQSFALEKSFYWQNGMQNWNVNLFSFFVGHLAPSSYSVTCSTFYFCEALWKILSQSEDFNDITAHLREFVLQIQYYTAWNLEKDIIKSCVQGYTERRCDLRSKTLQNSCINYSNHTLLNHLDWIGYYSFRINPFELPKSSN